MKRASLIILLILFFVVVMSASGAQLRGGGGYQASLVADINTGVSSSYPADMIRFNGKLYFQADDGLHGFELWEYDGISAPKMTADIRVGLNGSYPGKFATYKNKLYFSAYHDTWGRELWVYDGVNPPNQVMNINPLITDPIQGRTTGPKGSSPSHLTVFYGRLYFSATDGTSGIELWQYNGVNPPTMTHDINTGAGGSYPSSMTIFNNKLYFSANDAIYGKELWQFDGVGIPSRVLDINPGLPSSSPQMFTVFGNKLYFQANDGTIGPELFIYTGSGSPSFVDIYPGANGSMPTEFAVYNSKLYFSAYEPTEGRELYMCDGVVCGLDYNIFYPAAGSSSPTWLVEFNGYLYFRADNGLFGSELMQYDGSNPPSIIADINSGAVSSYPSDMIVFKDKLFFRADDGINGFEFWEHGPQTLQDMFYSQSAYDGWVLETTENSNAGGLINTTNLLCNIGDDAFDRQYRTILHFNTSRIPDHAYITKVSVQYKQHSVIGSDPYATHGKVWADIKDGFFSNNPGLVKSDFAAAPSKNNAGYFVFTPSSLAYPIYRASINSNYFQYLNLDGITQFRLRFGLDDDNDNTADYLRIFCGDMPVPFNRPNLRVWYYYDPD